MAFYNRRLETVARKRLNNGTYGRNNLDHTYFLRKSFEGSPLALGHLLRGLRTWFKLEIQNAFTQPLPDFADSPNNSRISTQIDNSLDQMVSMGEKASAKQTTEPAFEAAK